MIGLSPAMSWLVVGVVVGFAVTVYLLAAARLDRQETELDDLRRLNGHPEVPTAPLIRVFGGPYDHEARGDFRWSLGHDPIIDHDRCEVCNALLRRAFNRLADRIMGPRDADELMAAIREELAS